MAKAQFHKNQRVYVKPVGTWALVERVLPQWTKGLDEPLRIFYDVGLGREFSADELQAEQPAAETAVGNTEAWRVIRARNKWQPAEDCARHPVPGTYPVVDHRPGRLGRLARARRGIRSRSRPRRTPGAAHRQCAAI